MPVNNPGSSGGGGGAGFTIDSDGYISFTGSSDLPRKIVEESLGGGSYRVRVMVKHPVLGQLTHSVSEHP